MNLPEWAYAPAGDLDTPTGPRNPGYVHSTVSPAAQWRRGELPMGDAETRFGLPRPQVMREPGTAAGVLALADGNVVVNLAQG